VEKQTLRERLRSTWNSETGHGKLGKKIHGELHGDFPSWEIIIVLFFGEKKGENVKAQCSCTLISKLSRIYYFIILRCKINPTVFMFKATYAFLAFLTKILVVRKRIRCYDIRHCAEYKNSFNADNGHFNVILFAGKQ